MLAFLFGLIWWLTKAIFVVGISFILLPIIIILGGFLIGMVLSLVEFIVNLFWG